MLISGWKTYFLLNVPNVPETVWKCILDHSRPRTSDMRTWSQESYLIGDRLPKNTEIDTSFTWLVCLCCTMATNFPTTVRTVQYNHVYGWWKTAKEQHWTGSCHAMRRWWNMAARLSFKGECNCHAKRVESVRWCWRIRDIPLLFVNPLVIRILGNATNVWAVNLVAIVIRVVLH